MKRALAFTLMVLAIMIIAVSCEEPQAHIHTYSEKWECDDTYHWHKATCEDTDEVDGKEAHKFGNLITDTAATESTTGKGHRVCSVCGYEREEEISALGHSHKLSSVYSKDATGHWQTCSGCNSKVNYSSHKLNCVSTGAVNHRQECSVCNYHEKEEKHKLAVTTYDSGNKEQWCEECNYKESLVAVETVETEVTAVSKADSSKSGSTTITVVNSEGKTETEIVSNSRIVENTTTVKIEAKVAATGTSKTEDSDSSSTTTKTPSTVVEFPEGALKMKENATNVSLTVTALAVSEVSSDTNYAVEKVAVTSEGGEGGSTTTDVEPAVVAGFEFTLSGADSSNLTGTGTAGNEGATVTTYISKGLGDKSGLQVVYVGKTVTETADNKAKVKEYDNETGKLVFTVYHFSKYAIVSTNMVAVNSNGTLYTTLSDAIKGEDTVSGSAIKLLKNIDSLGDTIEIDETLTIDLNGKTLKSNARVFLVHKGTLTIKGGTIETSEELANNSSAIRIDCEKGDASVVLSSDAILKAKNSYGIAAFGEKNKATIDVYGTIESANPCIAGNGSKDYFGCDVTMNVYDGSKLTQDKSYTTKADSWTSDKDYVAIYQPNIGTLNISGGTITSKNGSAVEIRAGVANISGGTLGSEAEYKTKYNNNGPSVTGAAVAVSQHTSALSQKEREIKITVTISGGTFSATGTNGKQLAVVDTLTDSTIENKKLVKVVVKSNVGMTSDNIVGTKAEDSSGVSGTYYIDAASALADGADKCNELYEFYKVKVSSEKDFPLFCDNENSEKKESVVIDGRLNNGGKTVISEWQDLWAYGDVTISNFEFSNGVTISAGYYGEDITIKFENCIFHGTDQISLFENAKKAGVTPDAELGGQKNVITGYPTFKSAYNSRNEMGLTIRTNNNTNTEDAKKTVNVVITNCSFIGKNNKTVDREPGYADYATWYKEGNPNKKAHGIGLGSKEDNCYHLKSAIIEHCTFEGIVSHAIHVADFNGSVEIKNNIFTSYGINSTNYAENATTFNDVAIRGVLKEGGSLTLSGNQYNNSKDGEKIEVTGYNGTIQ